MLDRVVHGSLVIVVSLTELNKNWKAFVNTIGGGESFKLR